jgi:hypothetical protein
MRALEDRCGTPDARERELFHDVVSVMSFERVTSVEFVCDLCDSPGPDTPSPVVERANDGFRMARGVEGNNVPDRAHTQVGATCALKAGLARAGQDSSGSKCDETLPLYRPHVRLSLVAMESSAVIGDLHGDAHERAYPTGR